ncbi:hypothetical protein GOB93_07510 [Acetobacter musti]|uniref:Uncharacterized protein n=1 Tax=Acetobacter musti TaxID=864732 RepID=A0ABX0JM96_9PROT|nr:hypothetical protein [Acetobacter musti]NHN84491.1 hypothetical protein [Acetobacter musti]
MLPFRGYGVRDDEESLHPVVRILMKGCPSREDMLRAVGLSGDLNPGSEEEISLAGYELFLTLAGPLPEEVMARGNALEEAFRPLLQDAWSLIAALPGIPEEMTRDEARHVVRAWTAVHWALGARRAAMALDEGRSG